MGPSSQLKGSLIQGEEAYPGSSSSRTLIP